MHYVTATGTEEKKLIPAGTKMWVRSIVVMNTSTSAKYLHSFDNTAASGTRFAMPVLVEAGQTVSIDFQNEKPASGPGRFASSLYLASSTSGSTYIASTTADFIIDVEWSPAV